MGKEAAGAGWDLAVAAGGGEEALSNLSTTSCCLLPQGGQLLWGEEPHSPSQEETLGLGGHRPGWGSSPRHPVVKLLARLVVDGYGHTGVRVEGELHIVVHLGFADFLPGGLHLLRAPGEHRGSGR